MADIYSCINDFCEDTIEVFTNELKGSDIQKSFLVRKEQFEAKKENLEQVYGLVQETIKAVYPKYYLPEIHPESLLLSML